MQSIPLQAIPNQSFFIVLDNTQWNFVIKTTNGVTSVTIEMNNVVIAENTRAVANQLIIPAQYLESGNFLFLTQNYALPIYTQFGITQLLVYVTAEELAGFRQPPAAIITAADFDPIAALPLRFAPSAIGYESLSYVVTDDGIILTTDDGARITTG